MRSFIVGWTVTFGIILAAPLFPAQVIPPGNAPLVSQDALEDTPLLVARQSLLLARYRVLEQRYSDAIPPLLTAAEALAYFEDEEPGPLGRDAGYLRQSIMNYSNDVETDHQDAVIRFDDWIQQIQQWDKVKP
jgi:hypothetical protein